MKREDLKALGLTDEQVEAVMTEHGKGVTAEQAKAKTHADALTEQINALTAQAADFEAKLTESAGVDEAAKAEIKRLSEEHERALSEFKAKHDGELRRMERENETREFLAGLSKKFVNDMTRKHFETALNEAVSDKANEGRNRADIFAGLIKGEDGKERGDVFAETNPNPVNLPPTGNIPFPGGDDQARRDIAAAFGVKLKGE
jgi:hypothetical protein